MISMASLASPLMEAIGTILQEVAETVRCQEEEVVVAHPTEEAVVEEAAAHLTEAAVEETAGEGIFLLPHHTSMPTPIGEEREETLEAAADRPTRAMTLGLQPPMVTYLHQLRQS